MAILGRERHLLDYRAICYLVDPTKCTQRLVGQLTHAPPFDRIVNTGIRPAFVAHLYEDFLEGVEARKLTGGKFRLEITQQFRSPMIEAQEKLVCPITERWHHPKLDIWWSGKKLERVFQPIEDPCSICHDKFHRETSGHSLMNCFFTGTWESALFSIEHHGRNGFGEVGVKPASLAW
jgi:hypothetical protein